MSQYRFDENDKSDFLKTNPIILKKYNWIGHLSKEPKELVLYETILYDCQYGDKPAWVFTENFTGSNCVWDNFVWKEIPPLSYVKKYCDDRLNGGN